MRQDKNPEQPGHSLPCFEQGVGMETFRAPFLPELSHEPSGNL